MKDVVRCDAVGSVTVSLFLVFTSLYLHTWLFIDTHAHTDTPSPEEKEHISTSKHKRPNSIKIFNKLKCSSYSNESSDGDDGNGDAGDDDHSSQQVQV